jgi:hypothetical protein
MADDVIEVGMDGPPDMELDDIQEQADEIGYLTPREYAKLNGLNPQLVYYYIRTKKIEVEHCKCGRKVIHIEAADKVFANSRAGKDPMTIQIDKRSDEEREQDDVDPG